MTAASVAGTLEWMREHPIRFDEMPEMEEHVATLRALRVSDLVVRRVVDSPTESYMAMVVMRFRGRVAFPWTIGPRPSREGARLAAVHVVRSLVEACHESIDWWPRSDGEAMPDARARNATVWAMEAEYNARFVDQGASIAHANEAEASEAPGIADGASPVFDRDDYLRWRWALVLRRTCAEDEMTIESVGKLVGVDASVIAAIERGTIVPPPGLIRKLSAIFSIDEPVRSGSTKTELSGGEAPVQEEPDPDQIPAGTDGFYDTADYLRWRHAIRHERAASGLTLAAVARTIDIDASMMSTIERGIALPPTEIVEKLTWLFDLDGPAPSNRS